MNSSKLETELKRTLSGEVRFDAMTRRVYSVDASIFEVEPLGVVTPKNREDILNTIRIARKHQVPLIARGAATGITGGCIGSGLILDCSKHLNCILEVNVDEGYAVVEPGVVQDQLNEALAVHGYRLGPDTSTGNRATIGGMLANNAAGSRSLKYGKMVDHILEVELALANGEVVHFTPLNPVELEAQLHSSSNESWFYRGLIEICRSCRQEIETRFPKIPRSVSGYNLDELIKPGDFNLSKLIAGSEGSLGVILKLKVRISPMLKKTGLCLIHVNQLSDGLHHISEMLEFHPIALEMIDHHIIEAGAHSPNLRKKLDWLTDHSQALFAVEFEGETDTEVLEKLKSFQQAIHHRQIAQQTTLLTDPTQINHVWELRKAGLGLLLSKRDYSRAIAFIEDISIAPQKLGPFMDKLNAYFRSVNKEAGIYGHAGSGCLHIRPYIDLRSPQELDLMKKMMLDVADLLLEFGGSLSGEHGDGYIRSWLNQKMFGDRLYNAFCKVKALFDPDNLMNPGKIVHGVFPEHLRLSPTTPINKIETFLNFTSEGGIELAADLCNGNAACRKREGVMCPSFQATGDEYDTTRARAQALRAVIHGHKPLDNVTSPETHAVMDLCLECKGCKTECPSQVDMAKMKAEVLYQYQERWGYSWRSRLFANIGTLNAWGALFPKIFNAIINSDFSRKLSGWLNISSQRSLPPLARTKFSTLFSKLQQPQLTRQVVLFNDTYTEFNYPHIGEAAVHVLNRLGFEVIVPPWSCCGRPAFSKGFLPKAREMVAKVIEQFYPYTEQGLMIVGLEPSCILLFKDDMLSLLNDPELLAKAEKIKDSVLTFDEFVYGQRHSLPKVQGALEVLVHGHCHQKALVGMRETMEIFRKMGIQASLIDSGCCGMAGSFGYEAEHFEISMKIGSLKLFPAVLAHPQAILVANGVSCRTQVVDGTGRTVMHLAEFLHNHL